MSDGAKEAAPKAARRRRPVTQASGLVPKGSHRHGARTPRRRLLAARAAARTAPRPLLGRPSWRPGRMRQPIQADERTQPASRLPARRTCGRPYAAELCRCSFLQLSPILTLHRRQDFGAPILHVVRLPAVAQEQSHEARSLNRATQTTCRAVLFMPTYRLNDAGRWPYGDVPEERCSGGQH